MHQICRHFGFDFVLSNRFCDASVFRLCGSVGSPVTKHHCKYSRSARSQKLTLQLPQITLIVLHSTPRMYCVTYGCGMPVIANKSLMAGLVLC